MPRQRRSVQQLHQRTQRPQKSQIRMILQVSFKVRCFAYRTKTSSNINYIISVQKKTYTICNEAAASFISPLIILRICFCFWLFVFTGFGSLFEVSCGSFMYAWAPCMVYEFYSYVYVFHYYFIYCCIIWSHGGVQFGRGIKKGMIFRS